MDLCTFSPAFFSRNLVSVLMPSYNHENFIAAAIESVLCQTYSNVELIIVDDGSIDNTPEIALKFAERHPDRITFIRRGCNRGVPNTWNEALSYAKGDYIAPFASDDLLPRTAIEERVNYMLEYPAVDVLVTDFEVLAGNCLVVGAEKLSIVPHFHRLYEVDWGELYKELLVGNFIPGVTLMIRLGRIKLEELLQDPNCPNLSDYDLWLRLSRKYSWAYLPIPTAIYRWYGGNLSHPDNIQSKTESLMRQALYIYLKQFIPVQARPENHYALKRAWNFFVQQLVYSSNRWVMQILYYSFLAINIWRAKGFRALIQRVKQKLHKATKRTVERILQKFRE